MQGWWPHNPLGDTSCSMWISIYMNYNEFSKLLHIFHQGKITFRRKFLLNSKKNYVINNLCVVLKQIN